MYPNNRSKMIAYPAIALREGRGGRCISISSIDSTELSVETKLGAEQRQHKGHKFWVSFHLYVSSQMSHVI